MNKVLMIGLLPEVVDFSSIPGMTKEKLTADLSAQEKALQDLGFDARWVLVDRGATAEAIVRSTLQSEACDVVLIGAGLRTIPDHFALFERLINVVHQHAPGAKICFNQKPEDTAEAVLRWIAAPERPSPTV